MNLIFLMALMGCDPSGASGFVCEGITYQVSAPDVCPDNGCPMIIEIPGHYQRASTLRKTTETHIKGPEAGYIVVHPESPDRDWEPLEPFDELHRFILAAKEQWPVDPDRIHMTGFSQGGYISWYFACNHPGLLRSIAPVAYHHRGYCRDLTTVPFYYIHGSMDRVVPVEEGTDETIKLFDPVRSMVMGRGPQHVEVRFENEAGTISYYLEHEFESSLLRGHCIPGVGRTIYNCSGHLSVADLVIRFFDGRVDSYRK